ncbi:MAG TPA: hypothetical protein EYP10_11590 [Armatimonadetes bacterium]|nr:hypothetical protein [Armatimonadota bacterium]
MAQVPIEAYEQLREKLPEAAQAIAVYVQEEIRHIGVTQRDLYEVRNELLERIEDVRNELLERIESVRNELLERIESVRNEMLERIEGVRAELHQVRGELYSVRDELLEKIEGVRNELLEKIEGVRAELYQVRDELRNEISRLGERVISFEWHMKIWLGMIAALLIVMNPKVLELIERLIGLLFK